MLLERGQPCWGGLWSIDWDLLGGFGRSTVRPWGGILRPGGAWGRLWLGIALVWDGRERQQRGEQRSVRSGEGGRSLLRAHGGYRGALVVTEVEEKCCGEGERALALPRPHLEGAGGQCSGLKMRVCVCMH